MEAQITVALVSRRNNSMFLKFAHTIMHARKARLFDDLKCMHCAGPHPCFQIRNTNIPEFRADHFLGCTSIIEKLELFEAGIDAKAAA